MTCFPRKLSDLFQPYPAEKRKRMNTSLHLRKQIAGRKKKIATRVRGESATEPGKKKNKTKKAKQKQLLDAWTIACSFSENR